MILYAPSRASSTWKLVLVNKELRMANPHDTPVPENTVVFMHMVHIVHMVHVMQLSQAQFGI